MKRAPLAERFASMYEVVDSGCWEWRAHKMWQGYGTIWQKETRTPLRAHRASWQLHRGPIPDGLWVLHKCDNRACVNPDHLYLGTAADNSRDRSIAFEVRGVRRGPNKLSVEQVRAIRERLGAGESTSSIARSYGVVRGTVGHIASGKTWGWVNDPKPSA